MNFLQLIIFIKTNHLNYNNPPEQKRAFPGLALTGGGTRAPQEEVWFAVFDKSFPGSPEGSAWPLGSCERASPQAPALPASNTGSGCQMSASGLAVLI